jgi:hypothetical protein
MIVELAKISLGIAAILGGWLVIDLLWQRMFGSQGRRTGCHSCTCHSPCPSPGGTTEIHISENPDEPGEQ